MYPQPERMKRILTAIVLIALVAALIYYDSIWLITLASALIAILAALEFRTFAAASSHPLPLWWTVFALALFFFATFFHPRDAPILVASFATLLLFAVAAFRSPMQRVLGETAAGLLLLVYVAYPLALLPQILNEEDGTALLLFLFLCVWSGDIAALYIGRRFGRRKLAPRLSPGKTWAGSIASLIASCVFGMGLVLLGDWFTQQSSTFTRLHTAQPWWVFLLLAIALNLAAQFGDLIESAIKRGAGVKDSGSILPGHGGVLDRIDALLLAAPLLWFVLMLRDYFALGSL
jgi:phosphatidate cytidylyltransferase